MIRPRSSCSWSRRLRWFTSATLTIVLVMMPVPPVYAQSAVKGIMATASEVTQRARSRLSSAWFARLLRSPQGGGANRGMPAAPPNPPGITPRAPYSKVEREAKVAKLEMNVKGDLTLEVGQSATLMAIPFDADGNPVHGLMAEWQSTIPQLVSITKEGRVTAVAPGSALLTARVGQKTSVITVIASPITVAQRDQSGSKTKKAGGKTSARKTQTDRSALRAHVAMPQGGGDPRFSSRNAVGTPPGKTTLGASMAAAATNGTETPGSANFSFGLPVASSPGRGLNIDLPLFYNSRTWTREDVDGYTFMSYDVDSDWPAPGFRLGYGQLTRFCSYCGFNLVDPNGTRHPISSNGYNVYDSTDGTFIHLNTNPMTAIYPDGTQVSYGAQNGSNYYPTQITDRNGNYISIAYVGTVGPKIYSIRDTLSRYIYFYYASNGDLVTITAPGLTGQQDPGR